MANINTSYLTAPSNDTQLSSTRSSYFLIRSANAITISCPQWAQNFFTLTAFGAPLTTAFHSSAATLHGVVCLAQPIVGQKVHLPQMRYLRTVLCAASTHFATSTAHESFAAQGTPCTTYASIISSLAPLSSSVGSSSDNNA